MLGDKNACCISQLLTNCSWMPLITERVQSMKEAMHVIMMRQSNSTVRYTFLAAEGAKNIKLPLLKKHVVRTDKSLSFENSYTENQQFIHRLKAMQMIHLYSVKQVSKLTCSSYFPFSAFIDVNIIFQVDLYPAAVSLVVENYLLTRQAHLREGRLFL